MNLYNIYLKHFSVNMQQNSRINNVCVVQLVQEQSISMCNKWVWSTVGCAELQITQLKIIVGVLQTNFIVLCLF
jgi:hypothetical protein